MMVEIMVLNKENSEEKKTNFPNQIQTSNIATVCTAAYM